MNRVGELARSARVVVCCGAGGVGKTTTAATIALEAARHGRSAVVVTIDPARRLADALGIGELTNEPTVIRGDWLGEVAALMLDSAATFNALVARYAGSAEQAEKIMSNRFYRNISTALSGTQEYMATEKLYELSTDPRWDVVVVDTPPSRNALDFLEAPNRLARFLDHRLFRLVTAPTRGLVRAVNVAAQAFFRSAAKVVGGDVIADAIAFFAAFDGMEEGFKQRARLVDQLLSEDATAFVLVTSPRRDVVQESRFFAERLNGLDIAVRAVIVNRIHPLFPVLAEDQQYLDRVDEGSALAMFVRNLVQLNSIALDERSHLESVRSIVPTAEVVEVPHLGFEVHDLPTLEAMARHLFER
jgi:anion-transporting  ArsA/GET3 family ATPase